jgi:hypothetical protein
MLELEIRMAEHAKTPEKSGQSGQGLGIAARAMQAVQGGPPADYLNALNPEQRLAVETLDGPVLVLAGAGTGKTRVLTTRIAHILRLGRAHPSQILAVTFTNKAAREMKLRIGDMVGQIVEGMPWLGTFHAIGVKILRRHAELVGLKSNFTILDVDDQIRLIKQLLEVANVDEKRWPARIFAGILDGWKNRGLTPDQVPVGEGMAFANGKGKDLYAAYQERLKTLNACDFGDLLLEQLRLFRHHPDVLADYQRRFRYILVDEYQDTNVAQYLWLRLLGQPTTQRTPLPAPGGEEAAPAQPARLQRNICCVGDDDQSIYGWRGAEVDNILRFEKDFPGAVVVRLERNYRSTGHILAAASHLIAHNEGRLGKTLRTEDVPGEKVTVTGAWDSEEEARGIGEEIEQLQRKKHKLNEIAILVRASFQMREFEDRFVTLGLNYRVIGGPRFYERLEIRDAHRLSPRCQPAGRRSCFRAYRQHAETRPGRHDDPQSARLCPRPRHTDAGRRRRYHRDGRAEAEGAQGAVRRRHRFPPLAIASGNHAAYRACRADSRRERLHRHVAGGQIGRSPGTPRKPEGTHPLDGGLRVVAWVPGSRVARHGCRAECRPRCRVDHDAALGQGVSNSKRSSCPAGRKACSRTSARSTRAAALVSRRNAASPMSASPAPNAAATSGSSRTAASTASGNRRCRLASSTNCRKRMSK